MNKQQKHYLQQYATSHDFSIFDAYNNPSSTKRAIEQYYLNEMNINGGYDFRILSHNCQVFTCAYMLANDTLKVITPRHTYYIKGAN